MAGAGILKAEYDERELQEIIDALGKASAPDLFAIADSAGDELRRISVKAFENEKDPVTGEKWAELKRPNESGQILHGNPPQLRRSLIKEAYPDGSVIFGSNMVYARIHQEGGQAGRLQRSLIPARPYMGVPQDFDRRILNDPAVLKKLGL